MDIRGEGSAETAGMPPPIADMPASETDVREFEAAVLAKLTLAVGKDAAAATDRDWFVATALALRDRVIHRWLAADRASQAKGRKRVYYLSLEFLIGRLFSDVVENLRLTDIVRAALGDIGVDLDRMRAAEPDAALGNGGLGRLAACFMDSMTALGIPACGYGIRYDHGLFRQVIKDGWQHEYPGALAVLRQPLGVRAARSGLRHRITAAGSTDGRSRAVARARSGSPTKPSQAVAYDTPIVGWRGRHVNPLRLWSARAVDPLRLDVFNRGRSYRGAVAAVARRGDLEDPVSERRHPGRARIAPAAGVFLCVGLDAGSGARACAQLWQHLHLAASTRAIQLNDTHPSVAIAELMRVLVDHHSVPWDEAWRITAGDLLAIPTTRCCPRRWKAGRWRCSSGCCRAISKSSTRINARSSRERWNSGMPGNSSRLAAVSLIDEAEAAGCAWGISRFSARIGSTACRRCTPI